MGSIVTLGLGRVEANLLLIDACCRPREPQQVANCIVSVLDSSPFAFCFKTDLQLGPEVVELIELALNGSLEHKSRDVSNYELDE